MIPYTEDYYKTGNYINYLDKLGKYAKLSEDIYDLFKKTCILTNSDKFTWLDYGSGPGLFVKSLKNLPCNLHVEAFDISEWSLKQLKKNKFKIANLKKNLHYNVISFLDVLEHMEDKQIFDLFKSLSGDILLLRIPVASNDSIKFNKFHLDVSNLDKTHINCKTKLMWEKLLNSVGYKLLFKLNLSSIYDTDGVFCAVFKKDC